MTMSSSGVIDQLLNDGEFEKIAEAAIDFSILKGMVFRTREKPHSSEVMILQCWDSTCLYRFSATLITKVRTIVSN